MAELTTTFLGLTLRNPLVVGSSTLTGSVKKVIACEKAGAGAVVLKSLFEEQIRSAADRMVAKLDSATHPEAHELITGTANAYTADAYLSFVEEARRRTQIPIIASLNCVSPGSWTSYARRLEGVGADALELSSFMLATDPQRSAREVEKSYLDIARRVRRAVSIPITMKLGPHFSSLPELVAELHRIGIEGVTLFNRPHRPELDIELLRVIPAKLFSSEKEMALPLHWIGLLSGVVPVDLAASSGIHDAKTVIKQLLAGARVVELCTTLYENGLEQLNAILVELRAWMDRHSFSTPSDFIGLLSRQRSANPDIYDRSQYVKLLVGSG